MQFTYSALAVMALSGLAAAQIPACATQCLASAAAKGAPSCGASDVACQCEPANKAAIQALATPCVIGACPASELQAVLAGAAALCAGAGSTSASVAPSSSASVAPSSYAASTSAPAYTASSAGTLVTSTTTSATKTECPCEETSTTAASNGTVSTPTVVPFTGSASQMAAGFGSVFAIGFAVLAAF